MLPPEQQQATDQQHLRLLGIFHYIYGGFAFLGLCFLCGHYFLMRFVMTKAAESGTNQAEAAQMEQMLSWFIIIYILGALFCIVIGIGNILCGGFLQKRRNRIFILIVAGFNCLNMPLGTALGVFTFLVLFRPSVVASFSERAGGGGPG